LNLIWTIPAEEAVNTPVIRIQQASLSYSGQTVFTHLNLHLPAGKWVGLLGPSGIGKSSLLRMIAGLTVPEETTSGQINIEQDIAYMAQTDLLLPWLTVLQNANLCVTLRAHSREKGIEKRIQAEKLLHQVGLRDALHLYPAQLSGGMRQRVALVRTLMENKPIVLMDEPFSALDAITRHQLQALAADMLKNKTVLFVTHDPSEALRLADVIYVMQGQPATLSYFTHLTTETPRALHDPHLITLQSQLYQALLQAKETTS
jgi:putative hydroxymethylpyrimidine transport system ATP-binding protein